MLSSMKFSRASQFFRWTCANSQPIQASPTKKLAAVSGFQAEIVLSLAGSCRASLPSMPTVAIKFLPHMR